MHQSNKRSYLEIQFLWGSVKKDIHLCYGQIALYKVCKVGVKEAIEACLNLLKRCYHIWQLLDSSIEIQIPLKLRAPFERLGNILLSSLRACVGSASKLLASVSRLELLIKQAASLMLLIKPEILFPYRLLVTSSLSVNDLNTSQSENKKSSSKKPLILCSYSPLYSMPIQNSGDKHLKPDNHSKFPHTESDKFEGRNEQNGQATAKFSPDLAVKVQKQLSNPQYLRVIRVYLYEYAQATSNPYLRIRTDKLLRNKICVRVSELMKLVYELKFHASEDVMLAESVYSYLQQALLLVRHLPDGINVESRLHNYFSKSLRKIDVILCHQ